MRDDIKARIFDLLKRSETEDSERLILDLEQALYFSNQHLVFSHWIAPNENQGLALKAYDGRNGNYWLIVPARQIRLYVDAVEMAVSRQMGLRFSYMAQRAAVYLREQKT